MRFRDLGPQAVPPSWHDGPPDPPEWTDDWDGDEEGDDDR